MYLFACIVLDVRVVHFLYDATKCNYVCVKWAFVTEDSRKSTDVNNQMNGVGIPFGCFGITS